jgi:hypothetical protein
VTPQPDNETHALARVFRRFAENEARGYSPLYDLLTTLTADDPDLLELAAQARRGQPAPNLLLGAVHFLMLEGRETPLRRYYPSLGGTLAPDKDAFAHFKSFCLANAAEIEMLLATRMVQTNEVGRSGCLMPAFAHVASIAGGPIALVEVGASAGLNLLCDRYFYDYGEMGTAGDAASAVKLSCRVLSGRPPLEAVPAIAFRLGIDLNPIDPRDADSSLWLRALVWPEHRQRAATLEAALSVAVADPPVIAAGDGVEGLPALLERVPEGLAVCVFHSFVMNQIGREGRDRFYELLAEAAWSRPVFDISFEGTAAGAGAAIELARSVRGEWRRVVLAACHPHGLTMEWLV